MNKVTEKLGIEKPIIQGPLFWLTNAEMVAAVSNAGGMGTLGIIKIIYRPATPTKEIVEASVQMGADVIVATGFDEGGTVPDKAVGTFSAVPYVVDIVNG